MNPALFYVNTSLAVHAVVYSFKEAINSPLPRGKCAFLTDKMNVGGLWCLLYPLVHLEIVLFVSSNLMNKLLFIFDK